MADESAPDSAGSEAAGAATAPKTVVDKFACRRRRDEATPRLMVIVVGETPISFPRALAIAARKESPFCFAVASGRPASTMVKDK
jgi:hypothetical protein